MTGWSSARLAFIALIFTFACKSGGAKGDAAATGAGGGAGAASPGDGSAGSRGDGPDGSLVDADPSTPMGLCLGYTDFLASYFARCQGLPLARARQLYADPIICQRFVASIAAGRMGFDPTAATTCVASLASASTCGSVTLPGCERATTPLVPVGGTCQSFYNDIPTSECIGDTYCQEGAGHACTGVCTARAPIGAACSFVSGPMCTSGAICDVTTGRCAAPLAANQPCVGPGQASCQDGLYCDTSGADGGTAGLCHPQRQSGACRLGDSSCAGPAHCVGLSGAQSCMAPKQAGDACTPGARECDALGFCGSDSKCTDTLMAVGQPCGTINGEIVLCQTGAYCVATTGSMGVCQPRKQPGAACTGALDECDGNNGHCDTATSTCVVCPP